jgi:hypothetical protein
MLPFDDPLTRAAKARKHRQREAVTNLSIGLVLGGLLMNIVFEFFKGVM